MVWQQLILIEPSKIFKPNTASHTSDQLSLLLNQNIYFKHLAQFLEETIIWILSINLNDTLNIEYFT